MVVADDGWLGARADWRSHAHRRVTLAVAAVSVHTAGGSVVRRSYRQPHPRSQQPPPATGQPTLSVASDRLARAHCRQRQPHHDGVSPAVGWPGPVVAGDTLGQYDYRFDLVDERRGRLPLCHAQSQLEDWRGDQASIQYSKTEGEKLKQGWRGARKIPLGPTNTG